MNVAIVSRGDLFPPHHGAAVKIVRTAEALAALGNRVVVVTEDRDAYLRVERGVRTSVPYPPRLRAVEEWPPLPAFQLFADRLCARVGYPREEHFLYRPLFDPAWLVRCLAVARVEGIRVFQAEFPGYGVPAAWAARLVGGRSVVVQHNVEHARLREMAWLPRGAWRRIRAVETGILRAVDDVVAVSAEDRERMVADGVPRSKITVIPHGVDLAPFDRALARRPEVVARIRERHAVPDGAPLLFFHGVLHYAPNTQAVRFIVESLLPRLLPRHPDLRAIVAGISPPTYYAHPNVIFPGGVEDLAEYVTAADVALCPIEAGGGTRMKLLEYLAGARPTVSTTKGAEGLRFEPGREMLIADGADAFADAVLRVLADPVLARELGRAGARFAARYDWSAIGSAYEALYRGEGRGGDWNGRLGASVGNGRSRGPAVEAAADSRRVPGVDPKGPTLLLLLNRACNLSCVFCDLPRDGNPGPGMPMERALELLDQAPTIGTRVVVLTGGEPLLHPDLFRIGRAARERGMTVNLTTNGTRLLERWEELAGAVDSVSLSIDGMEATHDALRGHPGAWKKTVAALERLGGRFPTSVYFVVTRRNLEDLPAVFDLARRHGVRFDFWPVNHAAGLALREPSEQARYLEILNDLAALDPGIAERRDYLARGLRYHDGSLGRVRCLGLVDQYGVTPEGDLLPCCVWGERGLVVGNVFETPLAELWRSERVRELRERIRGEGCPVGCYNHSLFGFTRDTGLDFEL